MPPESQLSHKLSFFGSLSDELDAAVAAWRWPRFRGKQIREWVYSKLVIDPADMTNLSKRDQQSLAERIELAAAEITARQSSADGTEKLLLTWRPEQSRRIEALAEPSTAATKPPAVRMSILSLSDAPAVSLPAVSLPAVSLSNPSNPSNPPAMSLSNSPKAPPAAETVMIPDADRRTACVSSQVGCPVGCRFCASGMGGVKGNLTAAQIVEQVFQLNLLLKPSAKRVTNVVFMGMGEPLANYANVMRAVRILHDPQCFNIGARRITISTVGVPPKMRDLANEDLPINLAISLHAPTEPLRRQLIPWAEHFALEEILDAGRYYFDRTGREITLEYILLAGVNDQPEHARQLARLCKTLRANVNLIRYNPVAGLPYQRPAGEGVIVFQNILRNSGVNAHVRKSRGRDIDAACGQLKRKQERTEQVQRVT